MVHGVPVFAARLPVDVRDREGLPRHRPIALRRPRAAGRRPRPCVILARRYPSHPLPATRVVVGLIERLAASEDGFSYRSRMRQHRPGIRKTRLAKLFCVRTVAPMVASLAASATR